MKKLNIAASTLTAADAAYESLTAEIEAIPHVRPFKIGDRVVVALMSVKCVGTIEHIMPSARFSAASVAFDDNRHGTFRLSDLQSVALTVRPQDEDHFYLTRHSVQIEIRNGMRYGTSPRQFAARARALAVAFSNGFYVAREEYLWALHDAGMRLASRGDEEPNDRFWRPSYTRLRNFLHEVVPYNYACMAALEATTKWRPF